MIYYFLPESHGPSGGHQVLYRHVVLLNEMGLEAAVMHPRAGYVFKDWIGEPPPIKSPEEQVRPEDLVVVPEILAAQGAKFCANTGARFGIVNMDAYLGVTQEAVAAHAEAEFVLANGHDTMRIVEARYPVEQERLFFFQPSLDWGWWHSGPKEKVIAVIPRKRPFEWNIIKTLVRLPEGWSFEVIENRPIEEVREIFSRARVLLSLGWFESVSLVPLEAAAARCRVVGFTGFGSEEYWDSPIFSLVREGDPIDLAAALELVCQGSPWTEDMEAQRADLSERYSKENEREALRTVYKWLGFVPH
jgi:hypothetical protein